MLNRLATLIVKELLSYLRDPRSRLILIGPPLMQLLVFSFAATLEVRNVDIAVLDFDRGAWSQELVQRLDAAGFVAGLTRVESADELRSMIDRREVLLGIRFDSEFSSDAATGRSATVQVLLDGRRANAAQIALSYVGAIAADLGIGIGEASGIRPQSRAAALRHWFNPNLDYQWYIVPSLSGVLAMIISLIVPALSIARERELGTFDQLLVSPVTPTEIIVGKTTPALLVGIVIASVMMLAAVFGFRVPFTGSLLPLMFSLILFITSVVGIGLSVSAICQTQQQAILGAFMVAVPVVLLSGFATPVENMPVWLQYVAEANPLKHYLIIVQGTFLKALPASQVLANALPMAAIAAVTLTAATLFVRGRLQ
jgi:ABC-2 type transport system permease protein